MVLTLQSSRVVSCLCALVVFGGLVGNTGAQAQSTSTGSIQGEVTARKDAAVPGAAVSITNNETGATIQTVTNDRGIYASGLILPGRYSVKITAKDFQPTELHLVVHVGAVTEGRAEMERSGPSTVNGPEAGLSPGLTVQSVITSTQLEALPVNGRPFLDLAQFAAGTLVEDGRLLGPDKALTSVVSPSGRVGRAPRVAVDGVEINDEVVGGLVQNVPQNTTREFQVSQSMPAAPSGPVGPGTVNLVTRTGTNEWHGEGFYFFRDKEVLANFPGGIDSPFQRNQYGARVGGALIANKLFAFIGAEHVKQDLTSTALASGPFQTITGAYRSPFQASNGVGRIDWQVKPDNYRFFYRFVYDQERGTSALFPSSFQVFTNSTHTPNHAIGLDFTNGAYTHSLRAGFVRYHSQVGDSTTGTGVFNPAPQLELAIGPDPLCLTPGANTFCSGPSALSRRNIFQSNYQLRYDGARTLSRHTLRFGASYTRTQVGVFSPLAGVAPAVSAPTTACDAVCQSLPGGASDPLNYPAVSVVLGNGIGFPSQTSAFGTRGGLGPDNQISGYVAASTKWRRNLTVNYGVGYLRNTARTNNDLASIPCSAVNPNRGVNCTGNVLDLLGPGFGDRVRQPNTNLAPQVGLVWDPNNSGKTVIRLGMGLYYDNSFLNNVALDRAARLQNGPVQAMQPACIDGRPASVPLPGTGTVVTPDFCGQSIGTAQPAIAALQAQYQAAVAATPGNASYFGTSLASGPYATGTTLMAPNFKTPRSFHLNFGWEHEMAAGMSFGLNYVRNVSTHDPLILDVNHVGDMRYVDTVAHNDDPLRASNPIAGVNPVLTAINATLAGNPASAGCPIAQSVGQSSQRAVTCYLANVPSANIADFAKNGLDSADAYCGGLPCFALGKVAVFPGINRNLGTVQMLSTIGRSVYNGYEATLRQDLRRPVRGVRDLNWQFSYTISKYASTSSDNNSLPSFARDFGNTKAFSGPGGLDRRYQYTLGGSVLLPHSFRLGMISHFNSPLPVTLTLPVSGRPGGIFTTDTTGDGTGDGSIVSNGGLGDILPGTNIGDYGRKVTAKTLNRTIEAYNNNFAGKLTPAGASLVRAGVVTSGQLLSLGAVQQTVPLASGLGQPQAPWLKTVDVNLSWIYRIKDRVELQPGASVFNVANFANFNGAINPLSGILDGAAGSVNSQGPRQPASNRIGLGNSLFGTGSPRQIEFFMKISF